MKNKDQITEIGSVVEENAKDAPVKDIQWDASQVQTDSSVHLEDDKGTGAATIIRMFEFSANPVAFREHTPTKQELFNSHIKGIETMLWMDGLKVMTDVEPKVTLNKKKTKYRIFIGAEPAKGQLLYETPQTLGQIAHAKP